MTDKSFDSEESSNSELGNETNETEIISINDEPEIKNIELIKSVSMTLNTILKENSKISNINDIILNQNKMCFSSNSIPKISIYDYLKRIQTYSQIDKNTLILSLIYIDRICQCGKVTLTYYNIHRILFGAILISIKYNEDNFYDNNYYVEIAGIRINELNAIEYNFIKLCNFKMFVSDELFNKYNIFLNSMGKSQSLMED